MMVVAGRLRDGNEDLGGRRLDDLAEVGVTGDANDCRTTILSIEEDEALSDRVASRPIGARRGLAYDHDGRRPNVVVRVEESPAHERHTGRRQIARIGRD